MNNNLNVGSKKGSSFLFWACLFCAFIAGKTFNLIGVLYLGDILMLAGVCAIACSRYTLRPYWVYLAIFCGLVFFFVCLDIRNGISTNDMLRGLARNAVFVASVCVSLFLLDSLGLYKSLLVFLLFTGSLGLMVLLGVSAAPYGVDSDLYSFVKYLNGFYLMVLLMLVLRDWPILLYSVVIASSAALISFLDFRTGFLIIFGGFSGVYFWRVSKRLGRWISMLLFLGIAISGFMLTSHFFVDDAVFDSATVTRRMESNLERTDMADFAIQDFLSRPLTGYGSWQSADRYMDSVHPDEYISIHSMVLQYADEYGIAGIIWSGLILWISLRAFPGIIVLSYKIEVAEAAVVLMFILMLFYSVLFGGLGGYGRFSLAFSVAICIYLGLIEKRIINPVKNRNFYSNKVRNGPMLSK